MQSIYDVSDLLMLLMFMLLNAHADLKKFDSIL